MGELQDLLECRSAAALCLQSFDWTSRSMRVKRITGRAAEQRSILADNLRIYGGEPWPYDPKGDNSWVCGNG